MFQSILLCVQPTDTTKCRNIPLWNLGTTNRNKREHTNTCSDLHCHRISRSMVVASRGAKPPIRAEFNMVVASCVVFTHCGVQHRVRGCAKKQADINVYIRHSLASRQASPLSNVVAHRRQTTMASRLNRERECLQSMRGMCVHCVRRQLVSNDK